LPSSTSIITFHSRANLEAVALALALSGGARQAQQIMDELKSKILPTQFSNKSWFR
jgi:hypothetical protein